MSGAFVSCFVTFLAVLAYFLLTRQAPLETMSANLLGQITTRKEWLAVLKDLPELSETNGRIPAFFCEPEHRFRQPG